MYCNTNLIRGIVVKHYTQGFGLIAACAVSALACGNSGSEEPAGEPLNSGGGAMQGGAGGAPMNTAGAASDTGGTAGDPNLAGGGAGGAPLAGQGGMSGGQGGDAQGGEAQGGDAQGGDAQGGAGGAPPELELFSFFLTSLEAMQRLSGSEDGFGGDLRYGEATGLQGADKICSEVAEESMPGSSAKQWRAFLSVSNDPTTGGPVHAIDRIGDGPWYDRLGNVIANNRDELLQTRPAGATTQIAEDLPNEFGNPNHGDVDNHDVLTGSDESGQLTGETCDDWTITSGSGARAGHAWPANSGQHWISAHDVPGCEPSVVMGQGTFGNGVGDLGGYGAIYCFALTP